MSTKTKDHFVSVTFLKHFAKTEESYTRKTKIFVYNKNTPGFSIKEISIESMLFENGRDGKKGNSFVQKLETYEPKWNEYLDKIKAVEAPPALDVSIKEGIASYLTLLSLNNPKKAIERAGLLKKNANADEEKHVKQKYGDWDSKNCQRQVRNTLIDIGHFDALVKNLCSRPWVIFKNDTDIKFITSDDPIIVSDHGWYIPLSKDILLRISEGEDEENVRNMTDKKDVIDINKMMSSNAQRFFVSSSKEIKNVFGE